MVKENAPKYYKCLHLVNNIMENLKIIFNMLFMFFFVINIYYFITRKKNSMWSLKKKLPCLFFFL